MPAGRSRIAVRRKRRAARGRFLIRKPVWIDPYPQIPGTEPEKRIFAALIGRRAYFIYQDWLPEVYEGRAAGLVMPRFIADFILPQWRVIIDPFSDYHHMLPDQVERDAIKAVFYTSLGYTFYHPWASEVEAAGGAAIVANVPELQLPPIHPLPAKELPFVPQGYRLGPYVGAGATGVAVANRRRRRAPALALRTR